MNACLGCGKELPEGRKCCSVACVHQSMRSAPRLCKGCKGPLPGRLRTQYCTKKCEILSKRTTEEPGPVLGTRWVALTKGRFALVDEEDFEMVTRYSWYTHESRGGTYARSWTPKPDRKPLRLHHLVLGLEPGSGQMVEHKNQDGLDCRKENIRLCTESQNRMNTKKKFGRSKYKGVSWFRGGKWKAGIRASNQFHFLGYFDDEIEAAKAYDSKCRELHGMFGRYNFPEPGEHSSM